MTIYLAKRVDLEDEHVRKELKVQKKDVPDDPFVLIEAKPLGDGQYVVQTEEVSVPVSIQGDKVEIFIAKAVADHEEDLWSVYVRGMGDDWSIGLGKQQGTELQSVTVEPEEGDSALHIVGDTSSVLLERHDSPPAVFQERGK